MNKRQRAAADQQRGILTSAIRIRRPKPTQHSPPLPDYFEIITAYRNSRGERPLAKRRDLVIMDAGEPIYLSLHPFFLCEGAKCNEPVSRARLSTVGKQFLIDAGAMSAASPLQWEHIRHSTLSQVYTIAPRRIGEATDRSRHSDATFATYYNKVVPPAQIEAMKGISGEDQLELLMLG